jgi:hypothetical protein
MSKQWHELTEAEKTVMLREGMEWLGASMRNFGDALAQIGKQMSEAGNDFCVSFGGKSKTDIERQRAESEARFDEFRRSITNTTHKAFLDACIAGKTDAESDRERAKYDAALNATDLRHWANSNKPTATTVIADEPTVVHQTEKASG